MSEELPKQFGDVIRRYRVGLKMTQEDLAGATDITTTYIGMIERGESNVTLIAAAKIAAALNVKLSILLSEMGS